MERYLTYKDIQQIRAAYTDWFDEVTSSSNDIRLAHRIRMSVYYVRTYNKFHPLVCDRICDPAQSTFHFQIYDV